MGLFSFIKDAGTKLFTGDSTQDKSAVVTNEIKKYNITEHVEAQVDGDTITLTGEVPSLQAKQKVLTIAGNISGIAKVVDNLTVSDGSTVTEENFYDVQPGDNLSKIAKEVYGDSNQYMVIFEANKPMLSDPDKIYVGQKLVIPSVENA